MFKVIPRRFVIPLLKNAWIACVLFFLACGAFAADRPSVKEGTTIIGKGRLLAEAYVWGDDILQYGNWYGPGWWGGDRKENQPGDAPPIDSLDMVAQKHDMAYEEAKRQGKKFGFAEECRLRGIADFQAVQDALKLDENPALWPYPPLDVDRAQLYRDRITEGFRLESRYLYPALNYTILCAKYPLSLNRHTQELYLDKLLRRSKRLSADELEHRAIQAAQAWTRSKADRVEKELRPVITRSLSTAAGEDRQACRPLKEKVRMSEIAMGKARRLLSMSNDTFDQTRGAFICCQEMAAAEGNILDVKAAIMKLEENITTALAQAEALLDSCQSEADALQADAAYESAKVIPEKMRELREQSRHLTLQVGDCKNKIEEVPAILAPVPELNRQTLEQVDQVISGKDRFSIEALKPLQKTNNELRTLCRNWSSRIIREKWSTELYQSLAGVITRYCDSPCDVEGLSDEYHVLLNEAYQIKNDVRRMRDAITRESNLTTCTDIARAEIAAIETIITKNENTLAKASEIPQAAVLCTQLAKAISECNFKNAAAIIAKMPDGPDKARSEARLSSAQVQAREVYQTYQQGKELYERGTAERAAGKYTQAKASYEEARSRFKQARNRVVCSTRLPSIEEAVRASEKMVAEVSKASLYTTYVRGDPGGSDCLLTITTKEEMEANRAKGEWIIPITQIPASTSYATVWSSTCDYITHNEKVIPVGEPGQKAWGTRGWGIKVSGRWCNTSHWECPDIELTRELESLTIPSQSSGAVDLQKREELGGAVDTDKFSPEEQPTLQKAVEQIFQGEKHVLPRETSYADRVCDDLKRRLITSARELRADPSQTNFNTTRDTLMQAQECDFYLEGVRWLNQEIENRKRFVAYCEEAERRVIDVLRHNDLQEARRVIAVATDNGCHFNPDFVFNLDNRLAEQQAQAKRRYCAQRYHEIMQAAAAGYVSTASKLLSEAHWNGCRYGPEVNEAISRGKPPPPPGMGPCDTSLTGDCMLDVPVDNINPFGR